MLLSWRSGNGWSELMGMHKQHRMQDTSLLAWADMQDKLSDRHKKVLDALKDLCKTQEDATDQEIKVALGAGDPNYVRPRRYELVNIYKAISFSTKRHCKVTGKVALAWKPTRLVQ